MTDLYARAIWLRNCGRFTHVRSDFGSQYYTHVFVTGEALYASLTRAATWRHPGHFIDLDEDARKAAGPDYFTCDYEVAQKPVWFTPGLFLDTKGDPLAKQRGIVDRHDFNVVKEGYPSTGGDGRPSYVPTYGRIEGILPDQKLLTYAFSRVRSEVDAFRIDQVFLLGKKRTMFQIVELSDVVQGQVKEGYCTTGWLELPPHYGDRFQSFEVLAATMRYVILRGITREKIKYVEFNLAGRSLCLPEFYLETTPLKDVLSAVG